MADFLPMIRSSRGRLNGDRPLGMPDVSGGNTQQLLNQVAGMAGGLKDDDLRRQKELLAFKHSLENPEPVQDYFKGIRGPGPAPMGPAVGGMAPMQQYFRRLDEDQKQRKYQTEERQADRAGRLEQAMAEGNLRNSGEMARLTSEINARREEGALDREFRKGEGAAERGSRERVSQNELNARVQEALARRQFEAGENKLNRDATAANLTTRGQQEIDQINARPETAAAAIMQHNQDVQDYINSQPDHVQQAAVWNPQTKTWGIKRQGLTTDEYNKLRKAMERKKTAPAGGKPTGANPLGLTR